MRVPFSVTTDTSVKHNARNYFDFGRNSDKVKLVLQIIMDKKRHGLQIPDRMKLRHYHSERTQQTVSIFTLYSICVDKVE